MTFSYDQALQELQNLINNNQATVQNLTNLVNQVDVSVAGTSSTLLYSGTIDGTRAFTLAQNIASVDSSVAIIDNTDVAKFLNNNDFRVALDTAATNEGISFDEIYSGERVEIDANGSEVRTRINNTSLWDMASANFVENADGDVRTLTVFADQNSVFAQTELQALIDNPKVTSINGVGKSHFTSGDILKKATHSSVQVVTDLGYEELLANDSRWSSLKDEIGSLKIFPKAVLKALPIVGVAILVFDVEEAYANDGTQGVVDVLAQWVVDETEGAIGAALAVAILGIAIAAAPFSVPVAVGAGLVLAAGIVGGVLGELFIDTKAIAETLGLSIADAQTTTLVINVVNETITYNDIYVNGVHTYGNDGILDITDVTPNLVLGLEDSVNIDGTDEENIIVGNELNNVITGGEKDDVIVTKEGDDIIIGTKGDDIIDGGDGIDTLDYSIAVPDQKIQIKLLDESSKVGFSDKQKVYNIENITTGSKNDEIWGNNDANTIISGDGEDVIHGLGGDDVLEGREKKDKIYGDVGTDYIYGGTGNDTLYGGLDNDYLYGQEDNDHLWGDLGDDRLEGGAGTDTYHFTGKHGYDTIIDNNGIFKVNGKTFKGSAFQLDLESDIGNIYKTSA